MPLAPISGCITHLFLDYVSIPYVIINSSRSISTEFALQRGFKPEVELLEVAWYREGAQVRIAV